MSIYTKLLNIQTESIKLKKDAKNPFFKSKYITLDNIIDIYNPVLTEQKIACFHYTKDNKLTTVLIDTEDDTKVESEFNVLNNDPQKAGSEITYGKRYNLGQLLNIQTDLDDDGNQASSSGNTKQFYNRTNKVEESVGEEKNWFNDPEFAEFQKNNIYGTFEDAIKAIRIKYKLGKPMEEKVKKLYNLKDPTI